MMTIVSAQLAGSEQHACADPARDVGSPHIAPFRAAFCGWLRKAETARH